MQPDEEWWDFLGNEYGDACGMLASLKRGGNCILSSLQCWWQPLMHNPASHIY